MTPVPAADRTFVADKACHGAPAARLEGDAAPRTLHVVESLDRGAVETWLVRMLTHARARGVELDWTFYCALGRSGRLEEKALALGAKVIHSPVPIGRKVAFVRALRRELRLGGYHALHCHHDLISGLYLIAGAGLPIPRRIVHVHNADESMLTPSRVKQWLYRGPLRRTCLALANRVVGISNHTLDTFLRGRKRRAGKDLVHYYGVDPAPFEHTGVDRGRFRTMLGLASDAPILLFAGRMTPEKNPLFALDVLNEIRRTHPKATGVFAGAGSLEDAARERAVALGLADAVRFLGWRNDVAEIMGCCDWFILPRPEQPMEGFGLAVVEAQLAGLRLLLSEGIPDDPLLPTARFRRLSLSAPPSVWARAALELLDAPPASTAEARDSLRVSPMDMDFALNHLLELHR